MFYKGDWYPMSTICKDVRKILETKYPRPDRRQFSDREKLHAEMSYWDHEIYDRIGDALAQICINAENLAVLSNTCEIISVTDEVFAGLETYGINSFSSYHVDLFVGTFGSGYSANDEEITYEAKLATYGQFLYCPLLLERKFVRQQLADISSEAPSEEVPSPEVVRQIVEAYLGGELSTKSEYKQRFCPRMKSTAWRATWGDVVKECPDLGKAGRRPVGRRR